MNAGRETWSVGERVRVFRAHDGTPVWLPDVDEDVAALAGERAVQQQERHDFDVEHYVHVLLTTYAGRFRKAFAPADWEQIFRLDGQTSMFDRPIDTIRPRWIRCGAAQPLAEVIGEYADQII